MKIDYMTICIRGNDIEIAYSYKDNSVEVTCEQATQGGFNTLVVNEDGTILQRDGFTDDDVYYLLDFVKRNLYVMKDEIAEGILEDNY